MAASVQFRPPNRDLGMVMREVDEDLAIFLGMRNVETDKNDNLRVQESDHFNEALKCIEPEPVSLLASNASLDEACDHDWLLKQPDSSSLPSLDADVQDSAVSRIKISNSEDIILKSELEKSSDISASLSESSSPFASGEAVSKRPSSLEERRPSRRAAMPTGRQHSSSSAKSRPSRASTPTSRTATLLPSSKPASPQVRSSTPITTPRSSTPASRSSIPVILKSVPRSATPMRNPATPSTTPNISASGTSCGSFPAVKSRPSKPSDLLSLSHEAYQNPKVSMPKRSASASRGRITSNSSFSNEKPRQKSCSPAKVRAPITTAHKTGSKMVSRSRGYDNGDDVNPVVMGTKMVERVVSMRKLAPPKQDDYVYQENTRKSYQENSGFGRSLSKKSLEMAIRHMDIRRGVPDKSRTSAAGSVSGVQSGGAKISTSAAL